MGLDVVAINPTENLIEFFPSDLDAQSATQLLDLSDDDLESLLAEDVMVTAMGQKGGLNLQSMDFTAVTTRPLAVEFTVDLAPTHVAVTKHQGLLTVRVGVNGTTTTRAQVVAAINASRARSAMTAAVDGNPTTAVTACPPTRLPGSAVPGRPTRGTAKRLLDQAVKLRGEGLGESIGVLNGTTAPMTDGVQTVAPKTATVALAASGADYRTWLEQGAWVWYLGQSAMFDVPDEDETSNGYNSPLVILGDTRAEGLLVEFGGGDDAGPYSHSRRPQVPDDPISIRIPTGYTVAQVDAFMRSDPLCKQFGLHAEQNNDSQWADNPAFGHTLGTGGPYELTGSIAAAEPLSTPERIVKAKRLIAYADLGNR